MDKLHKVGLAFIGDTKWKVGLKDFIDKCMNNIGENAEVWTEPMQEYMMVTSADMDIPEDYHDRRDLATQIIVGNAISLGAEPMTMFNSEEIKNGYGECGILAVFATSEGRLVITDDHHYYLIVAYHN